MLLLTSNRNRGLEIGLLFLGGIGMGMVIQMSILSLQNIVKLKDLAAVTALGIFFHDVCLVFEFILENVYRLVQL